MDCLVSVIVPVHNTVEYLPRCIDSIRNQSLKDIEIILVENQSNDGSAALCDEYMSLLDVNRTGKKVVMQDYILLQLPMLVLLIVMIISIIICMRSYLM